jgi:hypothetical protein
MLTKAIYLREQDRNRFACARAERGHIRSLLPAGFDVEKPEILFVNDERASCRNLAKLFAAEMVIITMQNYDDARCAGREASRQKCSRQWNCPHPREKEIHLRQDRINHGANRAQRKVLRYEIVQPALGEQAFH